MSLRPSTFSLKVYLYPFLPSVNLSAVAISSPSKTTGWPSSSDFKTPWRFTLSETTKSKVLPAFVPSGISKSTCASRLISVFPPFVLSGKAVGFTISVFSPFLAPPIVISTLVIASSSVSPCATAFGLVCSDNSSLFSLLVDFFSLTFEVTNSYTLKPGFSASDFLIEFSIASISASVYPASFNSCFCEASNVNFTSFAFSSTGVVSVFEFSSEDEFISAASASTEVFSAAVVASPLGCVFSSSLLTTLLVVTASDFSSDSNAELTLLVVLTMVLSADTWLANIIGLASTPNANKILAILLLLFLFINFSFFLFKYFQQLRNTMFLVVYFSCILILKNQ